MRLLWPYIRQMRDHLGWVSLGALLALATLLASIGLLTLSGWFITATALAGASSFNFFTPGAGVRGFAILRTAGRYGERIASHEATFRLIAKLRVWVYRRIEPLRPEQLSRIGSAQLLNRLVADIAALDNLYLRVLSPTLVALVVVLLVAGFLALYAPAVAFIALAGLALAGILVPGVGYLLGRRPGRAQIGAQAELRTRLVRLLQGMADLRIYGGMDLARGSVVESESQLLDTQRRMGLVSAAINACMVIVAGLTMILALLYGAEYLGTGVLQPAQLAMLLFCVLAAFEAVMPLPLAYQYLGKTREAALRLDQVVNSPEPSGFNGKGAEPVRLGQFSFTNVSFAYTPERAALKGVDLEVTAGEKVVVLGHSGSGKSSLIALLSRFWDPQSGEIRLGGLPVESYTEAQLRAQMSVMSQPVQLFAGTVRDNLKLAADDLDDTQLERLLDELDLMSGLSGQGLDYQVGESGVRLSGGQRKRLALARALLRSAPILLLDEPTEGLDAETEARALAALLEYAKERTVLLITHHPIALERFDRVVVMDSGRVVEQGSPAQLLTDPESCLARLRSI
ncbi:heme ABC transporter ATP-binding protein/permease CydC [Marinobacterium lutimaris]|uniref:ATP-binding cassette, subfamily C, CydC n=1 Tax=Marinobacterium lutimaris TaxID=568106 RepID=A0A1H5WLR3_9GAMM|nr:cysteine/glutathione ABC transporter ATP-binding protein/permease CydC [Marinobacterium lutimaris]SEG00261.1 ATP-binding cassette, subfamily C, CydC [Marinobacterium lutimaris]